MIDPEPFTGVAGRLRQARERSGQTLQSLAEQVGLNSNYWGDLETADQEVTANLSLAHLGLLCEIFGTTPRALLLGTSAKASPRSLGFSNLTAALHERIHRDQLTVDEASSLAGWELREILIDPDELWNFTVDGLRDVSRFAGIEWTDLLPLIEARQG